MYDLLLLTFILIIAFIAFVVYLKYRLSIDNNLQMDKYVGGKDDIVIHISGPSGSGKTTLGKKLESEFNITMKDLDDLRDEFARDHCSSDNWICIDEIEYQKYIDEFIKKQPKPLLLVGLTDNVRGNKNHYYNVHPTHKYYISMDDIDINAQKCMRFLKNTANDQNAINQLKNNNALFLKTSIDGILLDCNILNTVRINRMWNEYYSSQGYTFMTQDKIYDEISKLLSEFRK